MPTKADVLALFPPDYEVGNGTAAQFINVMEAATQLLREYAYADAPFGETLTRFASEVGRLVVRQEYPDVLEPLAPLPEGARGDLCWLLLELVNCLRSGRVINTGGLLFYADAILSANNVDLLAAIKTSVASADESA